MSRSGTVRHLRGYLTDLYSTSPSRVWLAFTLTVMVALTQGVGLLLLVPLLGGVGLDTDEGALGHIEQWVASMFAAWGAEPSLVGVLVLYVLTLSLQAGLQRWQAVVGTALDERMLLALRTRLYRAMLHARWRYMLRQRASDLTHALTSEIDRIGELSFSVFSLLVDLLVSAVFLLLALQLSLPLTALTALFGGVLLLLLRHFDRVARSTGEALSEATSGLFAAATEHLEGLKTTKSYCAEGRSLRHFVALSETVAGVEIRFTRSHADARAWFKIGSVCILSTCVYLAIERLGMSAAAVLVFLFVVARLVPRVSAIQQGFQQLLNTLPAYANVRRRIEDSEAAAEASGPVIRSVPELKHEIRLTGVGFRYGEQDATFAIDDLNLWIPARQTTAVTGPSGAGKTTLADLVMGLLTPDHGHVSVDGVPLDPTLARGWRAGIGYVAQDSVLFHASIRDNLLWACPTAAEAEMWEALHLAAADEFVARLQAGLDTVIGDRGVRLSGGERQRIVLARALLLRPVLLILDEAMNALDSANEDRVQQAVDGLHGRITTLVITHRLSTVRTADLLYVLDQGRVVEHGTWQELAGAGRRFSELCRRQGINEFIGGTGTRKASSVP